MDQYLHEIDDVDVAFARLERVPPPANLRARVLAVAAARARARRRAGYTLIAVAVVLATALSFLLGQQLRVSGALELANLALDDLDLFFAAPSEFALALGELVPWALLALVAGCLGAIVWATRLALTPGVRLSARGTER